MEVDKEYAAEESFELPRLAELVAGSADGRGAAVDPGTPVAEGEAGDQRLEATSFDTADLRLAAARLTLRRRTGGDDAGWHLKVPAGSGARSEVRLPLNRTTPTVPEALRNIWAHSRVAALRPTDGSADAAGADKGPDQGTDQGVHAGVGDGARTGQ